VKKLIEHHRVVVCTGSGGVGKTTTSAALGVLAARMGKRVLVLTIDPARRLATALGIEHSANEVRVPGQRYVGALHAAMIAPQQIFDDFVMRSAPDRDTAMTVLENTIYKQLSTTLAGSQEFTSLARLVDTAESGRYDLVVLDTPPASHAVDFLHAPEELNAVFESTIVSAFMGRTRGLALAASVWRSGVRAWLRSMTLLTGSDFVAALGAFFSAIESIAPRIRETNITAHELLLDSRTAFVLVTSFDRAKIIEGEAYHDELIAAGYHLRKVIVNRAWPEWIAGDRTSAGRDLRKHHLRELARLHGALNAYYSGRAQAHSRFQDLLTVPELDDEVIGLAALERLGDRLEQAAAPRP
jgi:anion-transporting  ArsA/GET3 family ATPase